MSLNSYFVQRTVLETEKVTTRRKKEKGRERKKRLKDGREGGGIKTIWPSVLQ